MKPINVILCLNRLTKDISAPLILGSDRRAGFWTNILEATPPAERANKVMEVLGYLAIYLSVPQFLSTSCTLLLF